MLQRSNCSVNVETAINIKPKKICGQQGRVFHKPSQLRKPLITLVNLVLLTN